jgi:hypothetical protein
MSVLLKPIAMLVPTADYIYAPSSIRPAIEVTDKKFLEMAKNSTTIAVSFCADKKSKPIQTTVYSGIPGGGRYIIWE